MSTNYPWHWIIEWSTPGTAHMHAVNKVYAFGQSKFQKWIIVDYVDLGKALVIDGKIQSSLYDEFVYHESLVHPAMILNGNPKKVLILGGGEGATAREALRFKSVEKVIMVDIDDQVVEVCKKYLPEWHQYSFYNSKVKVIIDDAEHYIDNTDEKFDVIISDLVDPEEAGPAVRLYTREFYNKIVNKLEKNGIFVTQSTSPVLTPTVHAVIFNTIKSVFKYATSYYSYIRSFEGIWGFVIASNDINVENVKNLDVDNMINKMAEGKNRYYDNESHAHMFNVPKFIRNILEKEKRVSTLSNPIYLPA
ncbi:spermidine synthase [Caldisphaera lagunensis DSM 15908]|uniref:Polyamine aminopropyltransferase n=1 Tax=Caldisphaera lagunensis (strain DSM 15908 / JCM 11604 / ANMR 0165 / IC-154) TaxID=1056495 RepID=L0AB22_CALLD|nr:polyamine aminopropyltransferase [Caldisphaera lagunensis]AFZ70604.1 spermidine synthase [Caldisphaera lagunensis DSM 15908]